jgi:hypothetical protein
MRSCGDPAPSTDTPRQQQAGLAPGLRVLKRLFDQRLDGGLVAICGDALQLLAIAEHDDHGADRHFIGLLELRLGIEIEAKKSDIPVLRLLPELIQRQDLAFADRSPRRVDVDDYGFVGGELSGEVRLVKEIELDLLRHGRSGHECKQCERHSEQFFHGLRSISLRVDARKIAATQDENVKASPHCRWKASSHPRASFRILATDRRLTCRPALIRSF